MLQRQQHLQNLRERSQVDLCIYSSSSSCIFSGQDALLSSIVIYQSQNVLIYELSLWNSCGQELLAMIYSWHLLLKSIIVSLAFQNHSGFGTHTK